MGLAALLGQLLTRSAPKRSPEPLLVELFPTTGRRDVIDPSSFPFGYSVTRAGQRKLYTVTLCLETSEISAVRRAVLDVSENLDPEDVLPLTFPRLVEVLSQLATKSLAMGGAGSRSKDLSELAAYEAMGLSRLLALARDRDVTEFFVDSDDSFLYLDHAREGRCETELLLTERERKALATHLDTFGGYTADFRTPSLKNDLSIGGALLRVSLDLEPLSVNRFALDVRRLEVSTMDLKALVGYGTISLEAGGFLVGWLECGGNVTIVGETGSGKTTLLNALDEALDPRLRRVYIEDSVETKDLISRGYHQMKLKVDPFDRGGGHWRTKGSEIVKALHRSPDIVILSEIQSEEHSRAFFHSLAAGIRGMQTFHATTVEQAIGRWVNVHRIPTESIFDLGVIVQMSRPDRLGQSRFVQRICAVEPASEQVKPFDLFARDSGFDLAPAGDLSTVLPPGTDRQTLLSRVERAHMKLGAPRVSN